MRCNDEICSALPSPAWVPPAACEYLAHTEMGLPIRALARQLGCHPSTVMRRIRRYELRRDDPLVDEALTYLGALCCAPVTAVSRAETGNETDEPVGRRNMTILFKPEAELCDEVTLQKEGCRILRRLTETGAILVIAVGMEKAAVLRQASDGQTTRIATLDRSVAQAFALKDWISVVQDGKVTTYRITHAGRSALKRMLAGAERARTGLAEAQTPFAAQHGDWSETDIEDEDSPGKRRRVRYNMAESPVVALSRRRDKDGTPFLAPDLVAAAERLREDFELAQMGPRVTQNWERFLTAGVRGGPGHAQQANGPQGARERVALALRDLGPGLGDMVLRCCCFLEGLEATEKRMNWSARSGKIVLRIALMRLARHYEDTYGKGGALIG
ncbi:DUF6456 domain-containing protein [Roseicyclus sp. F158]|uniref:DUF6456 domain-containing protein n=1 Tax=Tropicimonas omnivorans TaxID=3075590 RepID=A0ABU3DKE0_9RHOB|nr:DUF6456 domain-containing protein [Roseicyclus sp. F158]MDT0683999.1 DUF6456 domain-containing protein [Roseicyclus sp. F158]